MDIQKTFVECKDTIESIRKNSPLVHNITNAVVTNTVANALLAVHASPLMAHDLRELEDINAITSALVVNIGTLDAEQIKSIEKAMEYAKASNKPRVFDPVGAGASKLRTQTSIDILEKGAPHILRANSSEIMAIAIATGHDVIQNKSRGVDANDSVLKAISSAKFLAEKYSCIVSVSGEKDFVTDGNNSLCISIPPRTTKFPLEMISSITGMGCSCSAIHGACLAVNNNALIASATAMAIMKTANHIAISNANGPASLQVAILDAMYALSSEEIMKAIILDNY